MTQGEKQIIKKGKHYNDRKAAHKQSMIAKGNTDEHEAEENVDKKSKIQVPKVIAAGGISKDKKNKEKKIGKKEKIVLLGEGKKTSEGQVVQGKNRKEGKKDKKDKKNKKKNDKSSKKEKKDKDIEVEGEDDDDDDSSSESSIQIEADNLADLDAEMEKQNEVLGELSVLKNANRKKSKEDKERKVTEFKFRVLDLLEIFVKKTNNPQLFLVSLSQIFNSLKEATSDKQKTTFVDKQKDKGICQVIKRFFERNFTFEEKYLTEVDTCLSEVMSLLAKEPRKNLNTLLTNAALNLLRIRVSMHADDSSAEFIKALDKTALKKDIFYSESLFKEALKISNEIGVSLLHRLLELALLHKDGGSKDKMKSIILSLLGYAAKNPQLQKHIKENPQDTINLLTKVCSVFTQHEEIKKKKIAVLKKYVEIFQTFSTVFNEVDSKLKKQLSEELLKSVNSWDESDHNLIAVKKKITEKCVF